MCDLVDVLGPAFEKDRFSFLPKGAEVFVRCEPDEEDPAEYFAIGDPGEQRQMVESIRERARSGDVWAWCVVRVRVVYEGFEEHSTLGACSYESRESFLADAYFSDMVSECFEAMRRGWERGVLALASSGCDLPALVEQAVKRAYEAGGGATAAGKLLGISRDQVRYRMNITKPQREGRQPTGQKSLP